MTVTNESGLAERLAHYDSDQTTPDEAYALFGEARGGCPVAYSHERGGYYLLMGYDDVKAAHTNWRQLSSEPAAMRPLADAPRMLPLECDPPVHTGWRRLFTEAFNPRTPDRIEAQVRADIATRIDAFATRGQCDLMSEFIKFVPLNALCVAIGIDPLSDKADQFHRLAIKFVEAFSTPELFPDAYGEIIDFGLSEVMSRREHPKDDYLTWVAHATLDGTLLTPEQIGPMVGALLVAGHETGVNGLAGVMYEVLSRPEIRDRLLADPTLIPSAVDEGMRMHPPFFGFYRRALEDIEISGVPIPAGSDVLLCWAAANRDPAIYPHPDEFRLDRRPARNRHLSFGWGLHACPGQPMAQMQMRLALAELLRRLPDIEVDNPQSVKFEFAGGESCLIRELPVRFTPSS